ncbi:hypothetical protein BD779DRAFT_1674227 [Infundibulicybe gibba]|nr:hypothetical protein BD779DRAFT_1674227 [Infundibulicybe gibba]
MVVTTATNTTPTAQANDAEKRRKHAMDRAKANHLSRQLQMRLQYARLKVDHGWQKQNLNEVKISTSTIHTPAPDTFSAPQSQSSLSFKLATSSLTRTSTLPVPVEAQTTDSPTIIDLSMADRNSQPLELHSSSSTDTLLDDKPLSETSGTTVSLDPSDATTLLQPHTPLIINSKSPRLPQSPTASSSWSASPSSSSHYPNVLQRSQPQTPTSTSTEIYNTNASSLTYDSFWSSHSTATGSRPFRASPNNVLLEPTHNQTTIHKATARSGNITRKSMLSSQSGQTVVGQ